MSKITEQAIDALYAGIPFKQGNTQVVIDADTWKLYLHGHCIARIDSYGTWINPCGYLTSTTRERLNGLTGVKVTCKAGKWYLNDSTVPLLRDAWKLV